MVDLLAKMLNYDPMKRITAENALVCWLLVSPQPSVHGRFKHRNTSGSTARISFSSSESAFVSRLVLLRSRMLNWVQLTR